MVLADPYGQLPVLASLSERMHLIALIGVQRQDGPPLGAGFASAYAVPMRLRDERLGALSRFATQPCGLTRPGETAARAMADVAAIGILHERLIRQREEVSSSSRRRSTPGLSWSRPRAWSPGQPGVGVDEALALLRHYARHHNLLLSEVARRVIARGLPTEPWRSAPAAPAADERPRPAAAPARLPVRPLSPGAALLRRGTAGATIDRDTTENAAGILRVSR